MFQHEYKIIFKMLLKYKYGVDFMDIVWIIFTASFVDKISVT